MRPRRRRQRSLFVRRIVMVAAIMGAVGLLAAFSGQAIGPILSGLTSGGVALTVEQAVTLDPDLPLGANPAVAFPIGTGDSATTRNDDGTSFAAAIEMVAGQRSTLTLYLQNNAGIDGTGNLEPGDAASAIMELDIPSGIDVEMEETGTGMSEARLGPNSWLIVLPADAGTDNNDGLVITFRPRDNIQPGYYQLNGRIIQTSGG